MLDIFTEDFIIQLLLITSLIIAGFLLINYYYHLLLAKFPLLPISYKFLTNQHKRILKKHFPFYNKLSPGPKRIFEQRVEWFFFYKNYSGAGVKLTDKKKLLVAAYAAQLIFGLKDFYFKAINEVVIYPGPFISRLGSFVSWEITNDGKIHLSWKDFFRELKNKQLKKPLGLKMMAHAIKHEKPHRLKEELTFYKPGQFYQNSGESKSIRIKEETIFNRQELLDKEEFMVACIINYFSNPNEFKNAYPELFKRLDATFYKGIN